jgi:Cys-tRNA(Pro) deacylase
MNYPITLAIRVLRENGVAFEPHIFEYLEKGGTRHSAKALGIDEHLIIKTLIFETDLKNPIIVLMHGNLEVSTKTLARLINSKTISPVSAEKATKMTGYLFGGTSPFGVKTKMPIYVEKTIFNLERIYINGGKRGFLVSIEPKILRQILRIEEVEVGISDEK